MDMHELVQLLNGRGEPVIFLGDGVPVYRGIIEAEMKVPYSFAPAPMNRQRASSVAALAMSALEGGVSGAGDYKGAFVTDAASFEPDYLRKSQAERQREAEHSPDGQSGKLPGDY